jgi:hypothetical protein
MSDYKNAWNAYKMSRNAALAAFFGEIIFLATAYHFKLDNRAGLMAMLGFFVCVVVAIVVQKRLRNWTCPRCGTHFFSKGVGGALLFILFSSAAKSCIHCGPTKKEIIANT